MKKKLTFIFLLISMSLFSQRGEPLFENPESDFSSIYDSSYALIIGQSNYEKWSELPGVITDVKAVKKAFENRGFHVVSKMNVNSLNFDRTIQSFLAKYAQKEKNRIIIYYAGHGHTISTKYKSNAFILPVDCPKEKNLTDFYQKAYPLERFKVASNTTNSKHILFIFDACFAGNLFKTRGDKKISKTIKYLTDHPVRHFITSGKEGETVPDESIFRHFFIQALESNEADQNNDGYTTGTELGIYLTENVIEASERKQHPQSGKIRDYEFDEGEFVFIGDKQDDVKNKSIEIPRNQSYIDDKGKFQFVNDCYLLFTGSYDTEQECKNYIDSMRAEGLSSIGYLWIPDIASLSGIPLFAVFQGPYFTAKMCRRFLKSYNTENYHNYGGKEINCYCKKVSNESGSINPEDDEIKLESSEELFKQGWVE